MSSIEDKLKTIRITTATKTVMTTDDQGNTRVTDEVARWTHLSPKAIEQIKQVFIDEGWRHPTSDQFLKMADYQTSHCFSCDREETQYNKVLPVKFEVFGIVNLCTECRKEYV